MQRASFRGNWPGLKRKQRQQGQALIYGIFVMISGLAALFFLFNTGQLTREKTKLVNTADAVAYSAGVMHARALNYDAYLNRASVANEVIIAQMVSLSSWTQYVKKDVEKYPETFIGCGSTNYYVLAFYAALLGPKIEAKCFALANYGSYFEKAAELIAEPLSGFVDAVEYNKSAIKFARQALHSGVNFQIARGVVMQEVADANYVNDGSVSVSLLAQPALRDDWGNFTHHYTGSERTRLAEVTTNAANTDNFISNRFWDEGQLLPFGGGWYCDLLFKLSKVKRRGGTELINFEEWKAEDTESWHYWETDVGFFSVSCDERELPLSWAEQTAYQNSEQDSSGASFGGSPATNPDAHAQISASSSSSNWSQYTGLPEYYDLQASLMQPDTSKPNKLPNPTLKHTVLLNRVTQQMLTSEGRSQIRGSPNLNNYIANNAAGVMSALSSSEVFFMRPPDFKYNKSNGTNREIASLFNPYWQVRLTSSDGDLAAARLLQGVIFP